LSSSSPKSSSKAPCLRVSWGTERAEGRGCGVRSQSRIVVGNDPSAVWCKNAKPVKSTDRSRTALLAVGGLSPDWLSVCSSARPAASGCRTKV
jgi:hypothetical protein